MLKAYFKGAGAGAGAGEKNLRSRFKTDRLRNTVKNTVLKLVYITFANRAAWLRTFSSPS